MSTLISKLLHADTASQTISAFAAAPPGSPSVPEAEPSESSGEHRLENGFPTDTGHIKPPPCPFVFGSKPSMPVQEPPPQDAIPAHNRFRNADAAAVPSNGVRQQAEPRSAPQCDTPVLPTSGIPDDKAGMLARMDKSEGSHVEANGHDALPPSVPSHGTAAAVASIPNVLPFVFGCSRPAEPGAKLAEAGPARPAQTFSGATSRGQTAAAPSAAAAESDMQLKYSAFAWQGAHVQSAPGNAGATSLQPVHSTKLPASAGSKPDRDAPAEPGLPSFRTVFTAGLKSPQKTPSRGRQRSGSRAASIRRGKHTPAKAQGEADGGWWHRLALMTSMYIMNVLFIHGHFENTYAVSEQSLSHDVASCGIFCKAMGS